MRRFSPTSSEFPNDNSELHDGTLWICLNPTDCASAIVGQTTGRHWQASRHDTAPPEPGAEPYDLPPVAGIAPALPVLVPKTERDTATSFIRRDPAPPTEVRSDALPMSAAWDSSTPDAPPQSEQALSDLRLSSDDPFVSELLALVRPLLETEQVSPTLLEPPPTLQVDTEVETAVEWPAPSSGRFARFLAILDGIALEQGGARSAQTLRALISGEALDPNEIGAGVSSALLDRHVVEILNGELVPTSEFATTADNWRRLLDGQSYDLEACGRLTLDLWAVALLEPLLARAAPSLLRRDLRRRGVAAFGLLPPL